ncbi:MAG: O-antigen ligase family protein [Nannocystaceae bacterium]
MASQPSPADKTRLMLSCAILCLFLLAGRWSAARMIEGMAEGLIVQPRTYLILAFLGIVATATPRQGLARSRVVTGFAVFYTYAAISLSWAPNWDMGGDKAIEMIMSLIVVMGASRLIDEFGAEVTINMFWKVFSAPLLIMAMLGLVQMSAGGRIAVLGGGPNVFGRNMGVLLLIALYNAGAAKGILKLFWAGTLMFSGLLVLGSGSRGALLLSFIGAATFFNVRRVKAGKVLILLGILIAILWAALALGYFADVAETVEKRFIKATLEKGHDGARGPIFDRAWEMGFGSPLLGEGVAAFANLGIAVYPHNIFLEAFAELGVVGVMLVTWILIEAAIARTWYLSVAAVSKGGFFMMGMSAMVSGDFFDSRYLFLFAMFVMRHRDEYWLALRGQATAKRVPRLAAPTPPPQDQAVGPDLGRRGRAGVQGATRTGGSATSHVRTSDA